MSDEIVTLITVDWVSVLNAVGVIIVAVPVLWKGASFIREKTGLELRFFRIRREKDQLLMNTSAQLIELEKRHKKDVSLYEEKLDLFFENVKNLIDEQGKTIREERYSERCHDRQQSIDREKRLQEANMKAQKGIEKLAEQLNNMQQTTNRRFEANEIKQKENEEREHKKARSDLKEKISRIYIKCNATKTITPMEFEVLKDLIAAYEDYGGLNSFVHSRVDKEMYSWTQIDE